MTQRKIERFPRNQLLFPSFTPKSLGIIDFRHRFQLFRGQTEKVRVLPQLFLTLERSLRSGIIGFRLELLPASCFNFCWLCTNQVHNLLYTLFCLFKGSNPLLHCPLALLGQFSGSLFQIRQPLLSASFYFFPWACLLLCQFRNAL